jgi:alpha-N-arabinofuranosidase
MAVQRTDAASWLRELVLVYAMCWTVSLGFVAGQTGQLNVDASPQNARKIPDKMFGIFFEVRLNLDIGICLEQHLFSHSKRK